MSRNPEAERIGNAITAARKAWEPCPDFIAEDGEGCDGLPHCDICAARFAEALFAADDAARAAALPTPAEGDPADG